jgi:hypothetical protein
MIDDDDDDSEEEETLALNVITAEMMPIPLDDKSLYLQYSDIVMIAGVKTLMLISALPGHVATAMLVMRHVFLTWIHEMNRHASSRNRKRQFQSMYADAHDQLENIGLYIFGTQDICIVRKSLTGARITNFYNGRMQPEYFSAWISHAMIVECEVAFFGDEPGDPGDRIDKCLQEVTMRGISLVRLYLEMEKIFVKECMHEEMQPEEIGASGDRSHAMHRAICMYPSAFDVLRNTEW